MHRSQGWNPLNYNILTKLPRREIVDLTADDCGQMNGNTSASSITNVVVPNINIHTGSGSFYLDKLIEEEKKEKGERGSLRPSTLNSRQKCKKLTTSSHSPRFCLLYWLQTITTVSMKMF